MLIKPWSQRTARIGDNGNYSDCGDHQHAGQVSKRAVTLEFVEKTPNYPQNRLSAVSKIRSIAVLRRSGVDGCRTWSRSENLIPASVFQYVKNEWWHAVLRDGEAFRGGWP